MNRILVRKILENACALPGWSVQGLGMLRLYLDDHHEWRLHVWHPDLQKPDTTRIHDHPWHFHSAVICGAIFNRRFTPAESDSTGYVPFDRYDLKCGEEAEVCATPTRVLLVPQFQEFVRAGSSYTQDKHEIHESLARPGTTTVIRRVFDGDRDHAHVFVRPGGEWVDAAPRPATRDEIALATRAALELL